MDLEERILHGMDGIDLAKDGENYQAIMNRVINPLGEVK
jgi:hypothetical protein